MVLSNCYNTPLETIQIAFMYRFFFNFIDKLIIFSWTKLKNINSGDLMRFKCFLCNFDLFFIKKN